MLIQELQRIQHRHGFLPDEELRLLSHRTDTPLYRLQELSSFYPHFCREPRPVVEVKICRDMSCHLCSAADLLKDVQNQLGDLTNQQTNETIPRKLVVVDGVSCLGRCDRAAAACIDEELYLGKSADQLCQVVKRQLAAKLSTTGQQTLVDNKTFAAIDTSDTVLKPDRDEDLAIDHSSWEIDCYQGRPEYHAIRNFVATFADDTGKNTDHECTRILNALETAGLRGMGGAGARTFKKWGEVRNAMDKLRTQSRTSEVDAYVVCNGDESEPGTFKDREILLRTPHVVLEGVILAGLFLKAKAGYIYIRHEYKEQIRAMHQEIERAKSQGLCGDNILSSGMSFPVEVVESPGGYICGEQTALIEALEGKPAEPRNRPPALQENGLWNKPTLLNNVETYAWVPAIVLQEDGQKYARLANSDRFNGKRFFSISGDINRPGVYEVPNGIKLRDLIKLAGGARDDIQAVALSGPSGGFLPRNLPRRFVEARLHEIRDKEQPTFKLLAQSARDLMEELDRLYASSSGSDRADEITQVEEIRRNFLTEASPLVQRLIAQLESFQSNFEPVTESLNKLKELIQLWEKKTGETFESVDKRKSATQSDRQDELTKKLGYRTEALGKAYTAVGKSCGRLEKLRESMFPTDGTTFDILNLKLDKQDSYGVGFMLGGGIVIYGKTRNMVDHALNCLQFFRNESCGQCVPCRIGSQKLVEIAHTLCDDQLDRDTWKDQVIPLVQELSSTMRETSICGLGEVAANPLISLMEYFEQDIDHHLK